MSIVGDVGAIIEMLMRVRAFYSKSDMVSLYKSHILPFIESGTPAYYHAHPSILKLIDEVQDCFCESMHISKRDALLQFNLAPLGLRGILKC